jgi:methionyl-tRNA synthetase
MKNREKYYITTAIDYVNAPPHIGHAFEKVQADVLARYARLKGAEVYFLTGVDEHGSKVFRTAREKEMPVKRFAAQNTKFFKELKESLNLSWNQFIRTSDEKKHWPGVVKMWNMLTEAGDLYKKAYRGLYCTGCEAFLTEKDLENGLCPIHKKEPEVVEEENYFFRLSAYAKQLKKIIQNDEIRIVPASKKNEILAFIDAGLDDVSFSRSKEKLDWGVPVPGDDSQIMYVWADALTNYISAIGYGRDDEEFSRWWPADVQVIGKDIVRFHALIWPAMLLAAKLPLPKTLFVHGYLNIEGEKISKSLGNVISPGEITDAYGTDPLRHYFLREFSSTEDGDFSRTRFAERYNADLANGLGNFVSRVATLVSKQQIKKDFKLMDLIVEQRIKTVQKSIDDAMEVFRFNDALAELWSLISFGDGYLNERKPWAKDAVDVPQTLFSLAVLVTSVGVLLAPFLPEAAEKIAKNISLKGKFVEVKQVPKLFPRIENLA